MTAVIPPMSLQPCRSLCHLDRLIPALNNAISDIASSADILSPFLNALPPGGLTPAQLGMTIQEFIVSETQRAYDAMRRDGETLKREFIEASKRQRAIVVDHLKMGPMSMPSDRWGLEFAWTQKGLQLLSFV